MNTIFRIKRWIRTILFSLLMTVLVLNNGCGSGNPYIEEKADAHSDLILTATDADFSAKVLGAEKPVLVDFWATWCGPCLKMAPTVAELAEANADRAIVAKVDVDKSPEVSKKYGITAIPTFVVFHQGAEVIRYEEMTSLKGLQSMLDKPLGALPASSGTE